MRGFATQHGDRRRGIDPRELSPQQIVQYRILGGTLIKWLDRYGPALILQREALGRLADWDPEPHIVIISGLTGLMAALEIIPRANTRLSGLTEEEYENFLSIHPDPGYRWHVVYRNSFTALENPELLARARLAHPITGDENYWIHEEESIMGELFVRKALHLWRWDGEKHHLLEEAFVSRVS